MEPSGAEIIKVLEHLYKQYVKPPPETCILVNIDDLLPLLRGLRKLGFKTWRDKRKRAIWYIALPDQDNYEILVDTTRTVERGKMLEINKQALRPPRYEFKLEQRYDPFPADLGRWWRKW